MPGTRTTRHDGAATEPMADRGPGHAPDPRCVPTVLVVAEADDPVATGARACWWTREHAVAAEPGAAPAPVGWSPDPAPVRVLDGSELSDALGEGWDPAGRPRSTVVATVVVVLGGARRQTTLGAAEIRRLVTWCERAGVRRLMLVLHPPALHPTDEMTRRLHDAAERCVRYSIVPSTVLRCAPLMDPLLGRRAPVRRPRRSTGAVVPLLAACDVVDLLCQLADQRGDGSRAVALVGPELQQPSEVPAAVGHGHRQPRSSRRARSPRAAARAAGPEGTTDSNRPVRAGGAVGLPAHLQVGTTTVRTWRCETPAA